MNKMPKGKKPSYTSSLLPENIRIREFETKDYDEVHRIFANSMLDNVPYGVSEIMQHRYLIAFWLGLTWLTVKNYDASPVGFSLLILCSWGVFLYMNLSRAITGLVAYDTRRAIRRNLTNIFERYNADHDFAKNPKFEDSDGRFNRNEYDDLNSDEKGKTNQRLARFWVAMDKDAGHRVIACCALDDEEDRQQNCTCIVAQRPQIKYLCVQREYRRCGIATALLDHASKFVNRRGGKRIVAILEMSWWESAFHVFDNFGFRETARESQLFGFTERIALQLDVESWARYRKKRKETEIRVIQTDI